MFKILKRGVSLVIVLSMVLTLFAFNVSADEKVEYPSESYWATEALNAAVKNKILYGRANGELDPEANLTRAEMAAIVVRSFGATIKGDISSFSDVSASSWYYEDVQKAVHMGAFVGGDNGKMYPDDYITREEIMAVLARLLVLSSEDYSLLDKFSDKAKISDWAKTYASALVAKKYINGNEKGMIAPDANVTRAEFAQMMHNIFKNYYSSTGTYKSAANGGAMINKSGVELNNVTINGDLVIGDGVGYGTLKLKNVNVTGRILFRGGERQVTITNTTVGDHIVIYDINGVVNFNNYRTEAPFKNIEEITKAKFKVRAGSGSTVTPPEPPVEPTYHTVTFHNTADPSANIGTAKIDTSLATESKTLKYIGKNLDSVYGNPDKDVVTYKRADFEGTNAEIGNVDYSHLVEKEYIYEESAGVWKPFTEETIVTKDIDVYLAEKHMILSADLLSIPYAPDVAYDSKSRAINSAKDLMILTGKTLSQNEVKNKVKPFIDDLYARLQSETGMVDGNGNILDKDYGMKIIDVISYNQIQAEIKEYVDSIIVGVQGESETQYKDRLTSFISMVDIPYLVNSLGGKSLVDMLPEATLRETLKKPSVKVSALPYIQAALADPGQASDLIDGIFANETATNNLINNLMANSKFIATMIELNPVIGEDVYGDEITLQAKILEMIKSDEIKGSLLNCISNKTIANEIIALIKADPSFKNAVVSSAGDTPEAAEKKMALRKSIIAVVAEAGKSPFAGDGYEQMSENGKKVKNIVLEKIGNSNLSGEFKNAVVNYDYVYEAVLETYVIPDPMNAEPSEFIYEISGINITGGMIINYAAEIDAIVEEVIADYFGGAMKAELLSIINDTVITFAENYINEEEVDESLLPVIETNIIAFIRKYFNGDIVFTGDAATQLATLEASIKGNLTNSITSIDDKTVFKSPIINFITNGNADIVNTFVEDNYDVMVGIVSKDFILNFINGMTDEDVNNLVAENADATLIVDAICGLGENDRKALASKILTFLDSYTAFTEFMDAFKYNRDTLVVNKENIYFASAVGTAIQGFDFEEIMEILKDQGFGQIFELFDEAVVEEMFVSAKNSYWEGLEPIIADVQLKTNPLNPEYVGDDYSREYTTKLNVTINAPALLRGMYNNKAQQFKDKIISMDIYDYIHNEPLKKLVNIDWFNLFIGYDANKEDDVTGTTGYYIRDYIEYYAALTDIVILYDAALCFYNTTNYDDEELKDVKKSLTKDFKTFIETLGELSDRIESGEAIYNGATLRDLAEKVDDLKAKIDGLGGFIGDTSAITNLVDRLKGILTDLGEGNLPNGYTVADVEILANKLNTVIDGMNNNDYELANTQFKSAITSTLDIVDRLIARLDNNGLESLISNIKALNSVYKKFEKQVESVISALADADLGSLEIPFDSEKYEDIIFGRETEDVFNADSVFQILKRTLGAPANKGYDSDREVYIVDSYVKVINGGTFTAERTFYNIP